MAMPYWNSNEIIKEKVDGIEFKIYGNRPKNLFEILLNSTKAYPKKEALVFKGNRLTYENIFKKVKGVRDSLKREFGVEEGQRVAVLLSNSDVYPILLLALSSINAVFVPINNRLKFKEIEYLINNSEASIFIVESQHCSEIYEHRDSLKTIKYYISDEPAPETGIRQISELLDFDPIKDTEDIVLDENKAAAIIYTSGTTGYAKGAVLTQRSLISNTMALAKIMQFSEPDKMLTYLPLFHVFGILSILISMFVGATNVIMERFQKEEAIYLIGKEEITANFAVPTTLLLMLESPALKETSTSSVRRILYGGAPSPLDLPERLIRAFPNAIIAEGYGLTETSLNIVCQPVLDNGKVIRKRGSVGVPSPLHEIKIVDENGYELEDGKIGELIAKGPGIMEKYWGMPDKTKETLKDGWLYTGDLAKKDKDGFIYLMGREKDMIIRGGENIYSIEIENCLHSNPKVFEASVVGIPDKMMGEELKAVIVLKEGQICTEDEITAWCKNYLADYKVPKCIEFRKELPKNSAGKVLKRELV